MNHAIFCSTLTSKDTCFPTVRDYLLQVETKEEIEVNYSDLITILKEAVPIIEIKIFKHMKFEIFEWIHKVQTGVAKGEINNTDDLIRNTKINRPLYNQILELQNLTIHENRTFVCIIITKETIAENPIYNLTNAHDKA